jgi:hypothetical protein
MVTIKMLVSMAGPDVSYTPGHLYEVTEVIALAWKEAGIAIPVSDTAPVESEGPAIDVETASAPEAPERAARVRRPR